MQYEYKQYEYKWKRGVSITAKLNADDLRKTSLKLWWI